MIPLQIATEAKGFGPLTWQVVIVLAGYLVLLGMQFANLIALQKNHEELKRDVKSHIENNFKHPGNAPAEEARIRALERVVDRSFGNRRESAAREIDDEDRGSA